MRGLGVTLLVALLDCGSQPRAPARDMEVRHDLRAPDPPVLDKPLPKVSNDEASSGEVPPPDSSPRGSAVPSTSAPPPSAPPPALAEPRATPLEMQQCRARGGTIQPVCMLGELACVVRYRDGGKRCRDKRDCTGQCLYAGPDPAPPHATGNCQRTSDPCGCKAPIHDGHVQPALCLD